MSTAKRSRQRQAAAQRSVSPLPAPKRIKVSQGGHAPAKPKGLGFLVDENARDGKHLRAELTNGISLAKSHRPDESRAVVAPDTSDSSDEDEESDEEQVNGDFAANEGDQRVVNGSVTPGAEIINISSDEESSELEESDEEVAVAAHPQSLSTKSSLLNGHHVNLAATDHPPDAVLDTNGMEIDSADEAPKVGEQEEPTFGELLSARHTGPIDVAAALGKAGASHDLVPSGEQNILGQSSATLGTVLTQALKTNDKDQLETCFQVNDTERIRATIERLNPQHVATLLQRISERIYSRPGRTGNLFTWIQWSLVIHGGYLATHADVMRKLKSLSRVVKERARGLQPLLHLRGKIDMLSAQLEHRRKMQQRSALANAGDQDDEDGVVYIEGQEQEWSDDGAMDENDLTKKAIASNSRRGLDEESQSDSDEDHAKVPNGMVNGIEDDSSEDDMEDGEDSEDMLDVEAEEASEDESGESAEDSNNDVESSEDDEGSRDDESGAEDVQQPKLSTLNRQR